MSEHGFGPENLPYGVIRKADGRCVCAVRLGGDAIDLTRLGLTALDPSVFDAGSLNAFIESGAPAWSEVRQEIRSLVEGGGHEAATTPLAEVDVLMPVAIGDYVDFYSSLEHATNLGKLFRPGQDPLLRNWRHLPVGYHGRAGTVVVSGTPVRRPWGQHDDGEAAGPVVRPEQRLDFESELGVIVGAGPELGERVPLEQAESHIFGFVLVNDWSARDIQRWEYQPLGPMLGKSFATSISPWVVSPDALDAARVPPPAQEPPPPAHLGDHPTTGLDIEISIELNGTPISRTNARALYWTAAQQLAHLTSNGSAIRAGDLLASGTISGADRSSFGSLIELTWNGATPLELADGSERTFLEDGDEVVMRGTAGGISLGSVAGRIVAQASP